MVVEFQTNDPTIIVKDDARICRRGHKWRPPFKQCPTCKSNYLKARRESPEGVDYQKRYYETYGVSDKGRAAQKRWRESKKGVEYKKDYSQSDKSKISSKRYRNSDEGLVVIKDYMHSEDRRMAVSRYVKSIKGTESSLRSQFKKQGLQVELIPVEYIEAIHSQRVMKRAIKQVKETTTK